MFKDEFERYLGRKIDKPTYNLALKMTIDDFIFHSNEVNKELTPKSFIEVFEVSVKAAER